MLARSEGENKVLIVFDSGLDARIVDLGRPRTRSLGVPVGGAADRRALILGNALVGNPPEAAGVEFALKGPRLKAACDVGCVIFGAPFDVFRGDERIAIAHTFTLRAGEELRIGGTAAGMRGYLCVRGGFDAPAILASRSGLAPLRAGDRLPCRASAILRRYCPELGTIRPPQPIRAIAGPQADWFDADAFWQREFTVRPESDRMGIRLRGAPLTLPRREMVSEPVAPGAVQVTNDGQCIILGVDGQTIGGYPKIAHVIQADLDLLGQLRPGQRIQFERISLDDAIARARAADAELHAWSRRLRLALDAWA